MLLTACAPGPPKPVEIEADDMCAFCKMAISQKQYCAELMDAQGNVFKFDDIGCMLQFAHQRNIGNDRLGQIHVFVRDFKKRDWINAPQAFYVQSESIHSPMASGLIAFSNSQDADRYAAQFHGQLRHFAEIWK